MGYPGRMRPGLIEAGMAGLIAVARCSDYPGRMRPGLIEAMESEATPVEKLSLSGAYAPRPH